MTSVLLSEWTDDSVSIQPGLMQAASQYRLLLHAH